MYVTQPVMQSQMGMQIVQASRPHLWLHQMRGRREPGFGPPAEPCTTATEAPADPSRNFLETFLVAHRCVKLFRQIDRFPDKLVCLCERSRP